MADLKAGTVLVANPEMDQDPTFGKSVIVLFYKADAGAAGVNLVGREVAPGTGVLLGGPMRASGVLMLHENVEVAGPALDESGDAKKPLMQLGESGYSMTPVYEDQLGHWHAADPAVEGKVESGLRFYGYAGWGAEQLDKEIEAGVWAVSSATVADVLAKPSAERYAFAAQGITFSAIDFLKLVG